MYKNQSQQNHVFARVSLACGMALLGFAGVLGLQSAAAKGRSHTVAIREMKYLPATLVVSVGDTVTWKNTDIVPHTVTDKGKSFDSGSIVQGASWSYVASKKGTYFYYCIFHPEMKSKLIVR
jgi:plastocyanin